jgi:hypothetical protein
MPGEFLAGSRSGGGRNHHRQRQVYELWQCAARGSDANPMSDRDLEDKLRVAADGGSPPHDIADFFNAIWRMDESADVSQLAAPKVPAN